MDLKQTSSSSFTFELKPLTSDFNYPILIIGFDQAKITIIDINNIETLKKVEYFDSPLREYS